MLDTDGILWIDGSEESVEARRVLDENRVKYELRDLRWFRSTDVIAPRYHSDTFPFTKFQGVEGVRDYAGNYHQLHDAWKKLVALEHTS